MKINENLTLNFQDKLTTGKGVDESTRRLYPRGNENKVKTLFP